MGAGKTASFLTSQLLSFVWSPDRVSERGKMSQDEQWELQFEHIDWNDIVDAELEGDTKALDDLK